VCVVREMQRPKVVCWTITSLESSREEESTADEGRASGRSDSPEDKFADLSRANTDRGGDDEESQGLEGDR
jgi:hypothetical protein